jgi:hypothetical protein
MHKTFGMLRDSSSLRQDSASLSNRGKLDEDRGNIFKSGMVWVSGEVSSERIIVVYIVLPRHESVTLTALFSGL